MRIHVTYRTGTSGHRQRGAYMWQTIFLSLIGGALAGNGLPHFVRGITKQTYPCVLGNGPIPNLSSDCSTRAREQSARARHVANLRAGPGNGLLRQF